MEKEIAGLVKEAREHYTPPASQEGPGRTTRQSRIPAEMICSMPTDQGQRPDCAFHAYTSLIIQNMISIFIDLRMTHEDNATMMACIAKHPIDTSTDVGVYSAEDCGLNGYKKIILFYYFFNYLRKNKLKDIGQSVMELIGTMHPRAAARLPLDSEMFSQMREEITVKAREVEWAFVTFDVDTRAISIVERILSLGLYCVLTLASDTGRHGVLLQGYDPTTLHIQNSWGKTVDSVPKTSFPVITLSRQEFRCERIQTVFPIPATFELPPLPTGALTPIDQLIFFLDIYGPLYTAWKRNGGKRTKRKRRKRYSKKKSMNYAY